MAKVSIDPKHRNIKKKKKTQKIKLLRNEGGVGWGGGVDEQICLPFLLTYTRPKENVCLAPIYRMLFIQALFVLKRGQGELMAVVNHTDG